MVDILFLAKGRKEFTEASLKALILHTDLGFDPDKDHSLSIYTDGDTGPGNGAGVCFDYALMTNAPIVRVDHMPGHGGPVACLNAFLDRTNATEPGIAGSFHRKTPSEFIAKIDNDLILCPGWLEACLNVMYRHPEVDLLGLEPWAPDSTLFPASCLPRKTEQMRPTSLHDCMDVEEWNGTRWQSKERGIRIVSHVGGIGLFRRSAFERFGKPTPNSTDGRYGFTEWQWQNPEMVKAFLDPPLPVFLLDHLPFQPWIGHSMRYEQMGVQRRQWGFYAEGHRALWDWWKP
jgi:hypothetical protein